MKKVFGTIWNSSFTQKLVQGLLYWVHFLPEKKDATKICQLGRWIFSTSIAAILGVVVLALAFSCLSKLHPETYRYLTKWVNQPPVPATKSCLFSKLEDVTSKQSDALKFLKWYDVKFKLDTSVGSQSLAVAYTEDYHLAVYNHGHRQKPKETDPVHLFIGKTNFKSGEFLLTVVHDSTDGDLEKLEYSNEECPIHLEFFGGTR